MYYDVNNNKQLNTRRHVERHIYGITSKTVILKRNWKEEDILDYNILKVQEDTKPEATELQNIIRGEIEVRDNIPYQTWNVTEKFNTQEEVDNYYQEMYNKVKEDKFKELNQRLKTQSKIIKNGIIQEEVDTFEQQRSQALEYQKDNNTEVPFLRKLAETRGIDIDILVEKILLKSNAYEIAAATILGNKHKIEDQIDIIDATIDGTEVTLKPAIESLKNIVVE